MHELSIVEALLEQVHRYVPEGAHATVVRIEAGPQQCLDPGALTFAWQALTANTDMHASLELKQLPWQITCSRCGHRWDATDVFAPCPSCKSDQTIPTGSNDLRLLSIEVVPMGGLPLPQFMPSGEAL